MSNQNAFSRVSIRQTIWSALTLNPQLYQDAQSSRTHRTVLTIVILAALSRGLGHAIISLLNHVTLPVFIITLGLSVFAVVVGYYFWTFTIWKVGQWLRLNPPAYRSLLHPIGFAYAPQIFNVINIVPLLGRPLELILAAWTVLAAIVAVRRVMATTTLKAAIISIICFPVVQIVPIVIQVVAQQFTD